MSEIDFCWYPVIGMTIVTVFTGFVFYHLGQLSKEGDGKHGN